MEETSQPQNQLRIFTFLALPLTVSAFLKTGWMSLFLFMVIAMMSNPGQTAKA